MLENWLGFLENGNAEGGVRDLFRIAELMRLAKNASLAGRHLRKTESKEAA